MPYKIKAAGNGRLVIVRHFGAVYCPELSQAVAKVNELINPLISPGLLVDVRAAESFPKHEEFFDWIEKQGGRSLLVEKVAFVTDDIHLRNIEAIALGHINRGINVCVFRAEMDALDWLL